MESSENLKANDQQEGPIRVPTWEELGPPVTNWQDPRPEPDPASQRAALSPTGGSGGPSGAVPPEAGSRWSAPTLADEVARIDEARRGPRRRARPT